MTVIQLLRSIDRFVDLSGIREHLKPFYSETGRPSIDPDLVIGYSQTGDPGSEGLQPDADNHAVREYLAVLNDAAFGAATLVVPKFLAPADPASRWTSAHHGPAF